MVVSSVIRFIKSIKLNFSFAYIHTKQAMLLVNLFVYLKFIKSN